MPSSYFANADYAHAPVRTETRVLILSTCKKCGASKMVSVADGSLERWEEQHQCKRAA